MGFGMSCFGGFHAVFAAQSPTSSARTMSLRSWYVLGVNCVYASGWTVDVGLHLQTAGETPGSYRRATYRMQPLSLLGSRFVAQYLKHDFSVCDSYGVRCLRA
ncbi:hypothetical protein GE09DRAFT_737900 [Coniochaeta sp. 2T2.1]|nr:hypothetical protein GE09DRAFT_737900 [Coniochaeta sp. 2T2.1]